MDVVQLRKLAAIVGRDILLKFFEGLPAQVAAIYQEEHPPRTAELDQPVDAAHCGEGLARAGGHLDQRAWPVLGQGGLQMGDRLDLRVP